MSSYTTLLLPLARSLPFLREILQYDAQTDTHRQKRRLRCLSPYSFAIELFAYHHRERTTSTNTYDNLHNRVCGWPHI